MELCFLLILLYLAQWGGGWWEHLSGFKSGMVEKVVCVFGVC